MLDDLADVIDQWKEEGHHIVLMMDCNEDVRSTQFQTFLDKCEMKDSILTRHGNDAPRTYIDGNDPIDGIFASSSINITAGGYCSFEEGVCGRRTDHRCLWIDVSISSVFGTVPANLTRFHGRRVKCSDPRTLTAFIAHFKQYANDHQLAKRIFDLESSATYPSDPQLHSQYESVARIRTQGIDYADKRCRKLRLGAVEFSPEYKKHSCKILFWKLVTEKKEGRNIKTHTLRNAARKANVSERLSTILARTKIQLKKTLKQTRKEYLMFKKRDKVVRKDWLEELAEARAKQETSSKSPSTRRTKKHILTKQVKTVNTAAAIKQIMTTELVRGMFRRIKNSVGKTQFKGISMVEVINDAGNTEIITDHQQITKALIAEYKKKYHQTENTPPMTPPMVNQIGFLGIGRPAQQVLNGSFIPHHSMNEYASLLLRNLQYIKPEDPLPIGITTKEYQEGWKKAKERTSSGGKIIHFGHCKALAQDNELATMDAAFLSIPMRTGYVFDSWKKAIDCSLQKKANSLRVDKLRTIVLFEADFNFVNKIISRKVAKRTEKYSESLADEQYGSRKDHRAIEHVLNKRLCMDLLRQKKQPGAIAFTDLKSCYDRICHSVASLCLQRQGVAESEIVCMFSPLQYLEHSIRCAYGDSTETYGSEVWAAPMQGLYQGNGAGPIVWAVVSSPVLQIMRREGFGTFFKTSLSGKTIRLVGYAFVDDTDFIQTAKNGQNIQEVIDQLQDSINMWEGLIQSTGGALAVDKGRWWAIDFHWSNGEWSYKTIQDINRTLTARDTHHIRQTVKQLETDKAYETLGVFLAPDGNLTEEIKQLKLVSQEWADRIRISFLRDDEAAQALRTTIYKKLEYPLLALDLTEKECNSIMQPVLHAALPKARLNRHFCRLTLFGPGSHLGLEFNNLYTSQIVAHLEGIIRHGCRDTFTGELIRGSIEAAKLEAGMPGTLFQLDYELVQPLITECWVKSVWHEVTQLDITIIERTPPLQLKREGDIFLIDAFIQQGFKNRRLERLNRCRIFLQVLSLADICSGNGSYILSAIKQGINPYPTNQHLDWPQQQRPTETMWKEWSIALSKTFPRYNHMLTRRLGPWLHNIPTRSAVVNTNTKDLFIKHQQQWICYRRRRETFAGQNTKFLEPIQQDPPESCFPAVAWITDNGTLHYHGYHSQIPQDEVNETRTQRVKSKMRKHWLFKWSTIWTTDKLQRIIRELHNRTAIGVTDGSFQSQKGTAGFCLLSPDVWKAACQIPGEHSSQCSYRSELGGILGILTMVDIIAQETNITNGSITIGCDNVQAGEHALEWKRFPSPTQDHFDILQQIHILRKRLRIDVRYYYVEGHQLERYGEYGDKWAKINDQMDSLAKKAMTQYEQTSNTTIDDNEWQIILPSGKVSRRFKQSIRHYISSLRLEQKWLKPKKRRNRVKPPYLTNTLLRNLDFEASATAWSQLKGGMKRFVSKLSSEQLPVGRYMFAIQQWKTDICPRCFASNETTVHVLCCNSEQASAFRSTLLTNIRQEIQDLDTAPSILSDLMFLLRFTTSNPERRAPTCVSALATAQLQYTPLQFLQGRLIKQWSESQQQYYESNHSCKTGRKWAASLLLIIWRFAFAMWDHRNNALHSTQSIQDRVHNINSTNTEIRRQWRIGPTGLLPMNHHLFRGNLANLLNKTRGYKEKWLQQVQNARQN